MISKKKNVGKGWKDSKTLTEELLEDSDQTQEKLIPALGVTQQVISNC